MSDKLNAKRIENETRIDVALVRLGELAGGRSPFKLLLVPVMNRLLVFLAVAAAACGPKPQKRCATSSTTPCLTERVCDFDRKLGCQVCTCRPWSTDDGGRDRSDHGPAGPPNAPGPPIPVH